MFGGGLGRLTPWCACGLGGFCVMMMVAAGCESWDVVVGASGLMVWLVWMFCVHRV